MLLNHINPVENLEDYILLKEEGTTVGLKSKKVDIFFSQLFYLLEFRPLTCKFNKIILLFFNCISFDENDGFGFLRGFGLMKAEAYKKSEFFSKISK